MNTKEIATAIKYVIWLTTNVSYETFPALLASVLNDDHLAAWYVEEHWNRMRSDTLHWLANLDDGATERLVKAALAKYSKA